MLDSDQTLATDAHTLPHLPGWITARPSETVEDVAFLSGAALSHLHRVVSHGAVPHDLWRDRLALMAAASVLSHVGRPERLAELRDERHLTRPGDQPGPAGTLGLAFARLVSRPPTAAQAARACGLSVDQVAEALDAGAGGPVARATATLQVVMQAHPRGEAAALMLADLALAQALRWPRVVPVLALGMARRDLRSGDPVAAHRAVVKAVVEADRCARDIIPKAAHLRAIAPKLRGKTADAAVALFLTRDAVAPWELTDLMSARAARRLCDRLVDLGAVRELTGRETYRIYGL